LPNGVTGEGADRKARLSVFVAPRLRAVEQQALLGSFPDFLDWPNHVQPGEISFDVEIENGPRVHATTVSQPPEPTLWGALFASDTPVESFTFDDFADRPIVTYSVREVLDYLKNRYVEVARTATSDLPGIFPQYGDPERGRGTLAAIFDDLVGMHASHRLLEGLRSEADLSQRISDLLEDARQRASERRETPQDGPAPPIEPLRASTDPQTQFSKLLLFHRHPADSGPVDLPEDDEAKEHFRKNVDFHQLLSALGDYPRLLRRLGLVFDLELAADSLSETPSEFDLKKLRIIPVERPADSSPWTLYVHATLAGIPLFIPAPRNENAGGLWQLPPQDFTLEQVDVDGAAIKALNMASSIARRADQPSRPIDAPDKEGVASLRTSGIALIRSGHAEKIHNDFNLARQNNAALESNQSVTLRAEDLTRGYRFDVWDAETEKWYSLHQRIGTYHPLKYAAGPFSITDEGFVQFSVTGPATDKNSPPDHNAELYIHEGLFTWDGWSLSAPRPGKSINRNPKVPDPDDPDTQPERPPNQAMTSMQLEVTFNALPGSLPRLRFGRSYRCRMRIVDLAGNSPTLDEATAFADHVLPHAQLELPAGDKLRYCRFEPVSAPVLVPRATYTEGESLERMVIRSNFEVSPEKYAQVTNDKFHTKYSPTNERHVVAPKASQQLVETHGMLDEAFDAKSLGLPPDQVKKAIRTVYDRIALKEKGSLNDTSGHPVHQEEQLSLPYLPDPIAEGAVFIGLPETVPDSSVQVLYDRDPWYEARPFRLRLAEGERAPEWDAAARLLSVQLPPAAVVTVRVSSKLTKDFLEVMGLFHWCILALKEGTITDQEFDEIRYAVEENRHWMFTPWRELTLVHAVQQPLKAPFGHNLGVVISPDRQIAVNRKKGSTRAHFGEQAVVILHGPSTSRLDLIAEWKEPRDDPSEERPYFGDEMIQARAQVFDFAVPAPGQELSLKTLTGGVALKYKKDRTLTFDTLRCETLRNDLQGDLDTNPSLTDREKDTLRVQIDTLAQMRPHEFGDTKYRKVRYRLVATSRFREYFAREITADPRNISRESEEIELHILNSAPPAAPKLLYVIPTFQRERTTDATGKITTSTRRGGGLRVYLDRGWFSSGEGELLGVVLGGVTTPNSPSYPYVTYWGQDPTWTSASLAAPWKSSVKNAVHVGERLLLRELPDELVTVVGFAVQFDESRRLWYSDIEFDTKDAYFPFVRLALVRYQPNSIDSVHVSPVVLADTVQSVPDRVMVLTRGDTPGSGVSVTVRGPAYHVARQPDGAETPLTTKVEAHIERRNPAITDDTLAWEPLVAEISPVTLTPSVPADGGVVTWTAQVALPDPAAGEHLRLVVEEREQRFAESRNPPYPLVGRLVYADSIAL